MIARLACDEAGLAGEAVAERVGVTGVAVSLARRRRRSVLAARGWSVDEVLSWRASGSCIRIPRSRRRCRGAPGVRRGGVSWKLRASLLASWGNRAGVPAALRAGQTFTADLVSVTEFGRTFPIPPRATFTVVSDTEPGRVEFCVPQSPEGEVRVGR